MNRKLILVGLGAVVLVAIFIVVTKTAKKLEAPDSHEPDSVVQTAMLHTNNSLIQSPTTNSAPSLDSKPALSDTNNEDQVPGMRNLIDMLGHAQTSERERSEILGKLYATRMEMSDEELQGFWIALLAMGQESGVGTRFHADTLWVLNEVGMLLRYKGILNQDEIEEQAGFLVDLSADDAQALAVRRMAITAIGDLKIGSAVPMLADLLADEGNWNTPALARSASIALSRLAPEEALKPVSDVLSNTTNGAIFGSAAYSMREMDSPEVLGVLATNRLRLGDNLSVDNTITELFPMVTNVLANPSSPYISSAIEATKSIWQEERRTEVIQQLSDIVQTPSASPAVRQQALTRLLEISKILSQEDRQKLLRRLDALTTDDFFHRERELVQNELNARILQPVKMEGVIK